LNDETKKFADTAGAGGSTLEKMLGEGMARPCKTMAFPGWRGKPKEEGGQGARVALWELGFDEVAKAEAEALEFLATAYKLDRYDVKALLPEILDVETKVRTLHSALRNPDAPTVPFARQVVSLRQLAPEEIQALYEAVIMFTRERSPFITLKSLGELEEVLAYLGKGPASETYFLRFDSVTRASIANALADRLFKAQTAVSSLAISSPSESTG